VNPSRATTEDSTDRLSELLARPAHQRRIEYKYRFAQAVIFGIPVVALQYFGRALGGAESPRWSGILQALLAGWAVYVGAAGMLFEGLLTIRQGIGGDLIIAVLSLGVYLYSLISVLAILIIGRPAYQPLLFHLSVIILAIWTGIQWRRFALRECKI
jgi:cation transport ATPase